MFRNFGCILSPFTEVSAMHKWTAGPTNFSATFVWIDPASVVAGSYEVKIETGDVDTSSLILHHKPSFRRPLRPGAWRLLLMYSWEIVAETRFLVTPLLFNNGKEVGAEQASFLHDGPAPRYVDHNFTAIENFLGLRQKQASQMRLASTNSRRFGKDLRQWMENLVSEFWTIQEICFLREHDKPCPSAQIEACSDSPWSSYFPDPKSEIQITIT
jgi:protein xylosyltransferase